MCQGTVHCYGVAGGGYLSNVVEFERNVVVCLRVRGQLLLMVTLAVLEEGLFWGHCLQ